MNYTKGEWTVTDSAFERFHTYRSKRTGARIFVTTGMELDEIAEVQGDTEEEAQANANLIAAAPDMYEALKLYQKHQEGTSGHYCWKCAEAINGAVTLAEGKKS